MSTPHAEQPSGADRLRGAVDLSSLATPGTAPGGGPGTSAPGTSSPAAADAASEGSWVIEQADQQVLQLSLIHI